MNSRGPSYPSMPHILCDYGESSNHDSCKCPYRDYIGATCAIVGKMIKEMTNEMVETMKARIINILNVLIVARRVIMSLTLV